MTNITTGDTVTINTMGTLGPETKECYVQPELWSESTGPSSTYKYYRLQVKDLLTPPGWLSDTGHRKPLIGGSYKPNDYQPSIIRGMCIKQDHFLVGNAVNYLKFNSIDMSDCEIIGFPVAVYCNGGATATFRGCIIRDCVSPMDVYQKRGHSQGALIRDVTKVLFEDCVFLNCGWSPYDLSAPRTKFNHGAYIKATCTDVTFRGCWFIACSNFGAQLRGGGLVEDCVFYLCSAALVFGKEDYTFDSNGNVTSKPRAGGCMFVVRRVAIIAPVPISDNIKQWGIEAWNCYNGTIRDVLFIDNLQFSKVLPAPRAIIVNNNSDSSIGCCGVRELVIKNLWVGASDQIKHLAILQVDNGPLPKNSCTFDGSEVCLTTSIKNILPIPLVLEMPLPDLDAIENRVGGVYDPAKHSAKLYIEKLFKHFGKEMVTNQQYERT